MKSDSSVLTNQPWLSPEVINFINNFMSKLSHVNVLEFGAGCSTIFFANMGPSHLVSIEHSPTWFKFVQDYLNTYDLRVDLRLVSNKYYEECHKFNADYFDLILIDGKDRMSCLQAVRDSGILKQGGLVILDDSDLRPRYKLADQIMAPWPKVELSGLKQNPLYIDDLAVVGKSKCWIRPQL